jgi:ribonuclease D
VQGKPPPNVRPRRRSGRLADPAARERYQAMRELRRARAAALGLEPEILVSNSTLEELARQDPPAAASTVRALPELAGWRRPYLVEELAGLLSRV